MGIRCNKQLFRILLKFEMKQNRPSSSEGLFNAYRERKLKLCSFCLVQLFGAKEHALAHDLSRGEFNDGARRNFHCFLWLFRIATDAFFGEADFKNTKVAKFHIVSRGEPLSDSFECQLNHAENLLLGEAGFFADLFDEIIFGKVWHKRVS